MGTREIVDVKARPAAGYASRWALFTFAGWLVICGIVLLWIGRGQGPPIDDWMLTTARENDLRGILLAHNDHLSVITVLIYKALFGTIGFSSYVPYRVISVAIHLLVVVLLRVIMRDNGVRPWPATLVAGMFALVNGGPLVLAQFQMTLGLAFGLGAVIVAYRRSRVWLGSTLALAGVLTSGVAIPVIASAGVIAWRRSGLRYAATLTLPAAATFTVWFVWNEQQPSNSVWESPAPTVGALPQWLWRTFDGLATTSAGGSLLALVLVGAVGAGLMLIRRANLPVGLLVPGSMAVGSLLMVLLIFAGRGGLIESASQTRFMYLELALLLPLVGAGLTGISSSNRWLGLLVVVPLAVGTASGLPAMERDADQIRTWIGYQSDLTMAMLQSPAAADTPDWVQPWWGSLFLGLGATDWGTLRTAYEQGRLNMPTDSIDDTHRGAALLRLRLVQTREPAGDDCEPLTAPRELTLATGDRFGLKASGGTASALPNSAFEIAVADNPGSSTMYVVTPETGNTFEAVGSNPLTGQDLQVVVTPDPDVDAYYCR